MFSFRDSDNSISNDSRDGTPIYRYASIEEIAWTKFSASFGSAVRIIVQPTSDDLPLDVLYIPRSNSRLIVGFHGAEQQSSTELPRFQFARSIGANRPESFLALSDSTMLYHKQFVVTWMVGDKRTDIAAAYAKLIQSIMEATAIDEVVLAGHSAGGTAAIRVGSMIPDSLAVAVNPQLTAADHRPYLARTIRNRIYPEFASTSGMLYHLRDRLDLRVALANRARNSRFAWFGHKQDRLQFTEHPHFLIACDWLGLPAQGGVSAWGDQMIKCNWKTSNENKHAMPGGIEPFLHHALGEPYTFDLQIS